MRSHLNIHIRIGIREVATRLELGALASLQSSDDRLCLSTICYLLSAICYLLFVICHLSSPFGVSRMVLVNSGVGDFYN